MKTVLESIKEWLSLGESLDAKESLKTLDADFHLKYGGKTIGVLSLNSGRWKFRYTDEMKVLELRPLVQFPNVDETYESSQLWPFFLMRLPSIDQAAVRETLEKEHINSADEVEMLRRFGRHSIANPFELVLAPTAANYRR